MEVEFYGAAGEVTGSCHIVRVRGRQLLLDCGMVQGGHDPAGRNREPFPFDAAAVDAVLLSHAHIDHCGRLPLLIKRGFRGRIFTNAICRELAPILLRDSAELAQRDADRDNRRRGPRQRRAEPLFTLEEVELALARFESLPYDAEQELLPGVTARVREAGHIIGSSSIELTLEENGLRRRLVFSGDLGQYDSPILLDPFRFDAADLVLMECTYGDRLHRDRAETLRELGDIIRRAALDGGNVLIPAFAIGRSQELLYHLGRHFEDWRLGEWTIYLDSPMAIEATRVYWQHPERFDAEALRLRRESARLPLLPNFRPCRTPEESRAINGVHQRAIIIAGSGMCNGGRILHHLRHNLWRPECHVIIVAFQAPGTLGRALVDHVPAVRIHGDEIRVAATVHTVGGLSAHGDRDDLLRWYSGFSPPPPVYLVHGEPLAARELAARLEAAGTRVTVARAGQRIDLAALPPLQAQ